MNLRKALTRAKQIEDARRERAFLPLPEFINGVTVNQFTLRHFTILSEIRSPFIIGGVVYGEDIGTFLWVVSPQYHSEPQLIRPRFWKRLRMRLRRQRFPTVREVFMAELVLHPRWQLFCRAISQYIDNAFMDRPPEVTSGKTITASYAASMVHRIARAYGVSGAVPNNHVFGGPSVSIFEAIMGTPMPALFQLIKWIDVEKVPETPQFTPLQSRIEATADRLKESRIT